MAACVVDIKDNVTVKARVLNPSSEEVSIKQDTVIGKASSFLKVISSLKDMENTDEIENFSAVRRLGFSSPEISKHDMIKNVKEDNLRVVPSHLTELLHNCSEDLSTDGKGKVANLLNKFQEVFSKHEFDIGLTYLVEHSINTGDEKPVRLPPRRVPIAFAEKKNMISQLEEQNIIRKYNSPWSAAIVIVVRKDQKICMCIDYRKINSYICPLAYPIARNQDCLDVVAGSVYFSTCDLTAGYYQIPVKESDIPKTAFATKFGLYEFTRLPFGTVNGSATCQRLMEIVLNGLQWQTCLIYLR